jgi:hypothetical protein
MVAAERIDRPDPGLPLGPDTIPGSVTPMQENKAGHGLRQDGGTLGP